MIILNQQDAYSFLVRKTKHDNNNNNNNNNINKTKKENTNVFKIVYIFYIVFDG